MISPSKAIPHEVNFAELKQLTNAPLPPVILIPGT